MKRFAVVFSLLLLVACGTPTETAIPASSAPSRMPSTDASTAGNAANGAATSTAPNVANSNALTVFAAASLTESFTEIGQRFDAANASTTTFNFAGSQQLAQQIAQGAPADVFASANRAQMENVIASGQVVSGTQQLFVRNRLVVIYPADNPAGLATLQDLATPDLRLVLAAKEVPVGQYSLDFLGKASESAQFTSAYSQTVLANVASYEENVRAVLSKVQLGEADAGIVYTSDITEKIGRIEIPDDLNTVASYPIAPIEGSVNAKLAQRFIEYVIGSEAQAVLEEYGFIRVSP